MTKGQSTIEYMLLLAVVVGVTLVAMQKYMPSAQAGARNYFNRVSVGLQGNVSYCGDGNCLMPFESSASCCIDCGGCSSN